MQDATYSNLYQNDWPDLPNNVKTNHSKKDKKTIKTICNDFINPPCSGSVADQGGNSVISKNLRCEAEGDGKCDGEIEEYNHFYFSCLAANVPGQPSTHNFCKYHFDNAKNCPVHSCFYKYPS